MLMHVRFPFTTPPTRRRTERRAQSCIRQRSAIQLRLADFLQPTAGLVESPANEVCSSADAARTQGRTIFYYACNPQA